MYKPRTMSEVAGDLGITVGTLTTAINNLVKKEYVERQKDEKDRRVVKIVLTKKGKLAYRVHEKFHSDMIKATIEGLTDEEEDRKSTRLNSSHANISYAVFCLKKKKHTC